MRDTSYVLGAVDHVRDGTDELLKQLCSSRLQQLIFVREANVHGC